MKKIISLIIGILLILQLCPTVFAADPVTLFVLPGATNGDGSFEKPYGTITEAKNAVRSISKSSNSGITVYLRGGEYRLTSPVEMTNRDSGTASCPITYTNYENEKVVIKGSVPLDTSKFTAVESADVLNRLDESVRDKVLQFDLSTAGLARENYGELAYPGMHLTVSTAPSTELFFGDEAMTLARYPNTGYMDVENVVSIGDSSFTLDYSAEHASHMDRWTTAEDAKLYGYWMWNWADQTLDLASVDAANNTITTKQNSYYSVASDGNQRYYAYNLLEELDVPGEYYIDRESNILYFYPNGSINDKTLELSVHKNAFFVLNGVNYTTIKGIYMTQNRARAITMGQVAECNNCHVENCTISYTGATNGSSGAVIAKGSNNGFINCNFENVDGGVELRGGDKSTLAHGGNYVKNCRFTNFSRFKRTYNPAVLMRGTGQIASNNLIFDAPHNAIMFEGTEHLIEYNEIHDVLKETTDAGAIYCGADVTARGNVVRYNYIHDIEDIFAESLDTTWCHGVYLDDNLCSVDIYGNVFRDIGGYGVFIGGGRDNLVSNNVFYNCTRGTVYIDQRGEWETGEGEGFTEGGKFINQLQSSEIDNDLWKAEYPEVFDMLAEFGNGTIEISYPKNNVVENNVYVLSGAEFYKPLALQYGTFKNNLTYSENPGFVSENDFTLTDDAQLKTDNTDFEEIPFELVGRCPVVCDIVFVAAKYNEPGNTFNPDGATLDIATNYGFMEEIYTINLIDRLGADTLMRALNEMELLHNLVWEYPNVLERKSNNEANSPTSSTDKVSLRRIAIQSGGKLYLAYNRLEGAVVDDFSVGVTYNWNGEKIFDKDFEFEVLLRKFTPVLKNGTAVLEEGDSLTAGQWTPQIDISNQDITFRGFYAAALYEKQSDGTLKFKDITYNSGQMTYEKTSDTVAFDKAFDIAEDDCCVIKVFVWNYNNNIKEENYRPLIHEAVFE